MLPTEAYEQLLKRFPNDFASIACIVYAMLERSAPEHVVFAKKYEANHQQMLQAVFEACARQYIKYRYEIGSKTFIPPLFAKEENVGFAITCTIVRKTDSVTMLVQTNWGDKSTEYAFKLHEHLDKSFIDLLRK